MCLANYNDNGCYNLRLTFCDDQAFFADKISAQVNKYFSSRNNLCVCDKYTHANELILACNNTPYDAVFRC